MKIEIRDLDDQYPRIYKDYKGIIIIDKEIYIWLTRFHLKHKDILSWHTIIGAAFMLLEMLAEQAKPNVYYCEDHFIKDLKQLNRLIK